MSTYQVRTAIPLGRICHLANNKLVLGWSVFTRPVTCPVAGLFFLTVREFFFFNVFRSCPVATYEYVAGTRKERL